MTKVIVSLGVILVIGTGMVLSVKDYRQWKYEETKNYGHGPSDGKPTNALPSLDQVYRNEFTRLRVRLPSAWSVFEDPQFVMPTTPKYVPLEQKLVQDKRTRVVRFGDRITVEMQKSNQDLTNVVRKDAGSIVDWAYGGDRVRFTLIQFKDRISGYAQNNGVIYIFTWTGVDDGTFNEILKTVVFS